MSFTCLSGGDGGGECGGRGGSSVVVAEEVMVTSLESDPQAIVHSPL